MNIAIVGLGLIGGSLAKAVKQFTSHLVIGMDIDPQVLAGALAAGAIDLVGSPDDLRHADLVLMALYPALSIDFIRQNADFFKPGALVVDCGGVKRQICAEIPPLAAVKGFTFAGGHPMAGREQGGFAHADPLLFQGASFIIVPCSAPADKLNAFTELILSLGFERTVFTTPEEHDDIIAYTSQLPHVLSVAYMFSPSCRAHRGFSAGSFKDVSRVALINERLWSELFIANHDPLIREIDILIDNLSQIKASIAAGNAGQLSTLLAQGRQIKQEVD